MDLLFSRLRAYIPYMADLADPVAAFLRCLPFSGPNEITNNYPIFLYAATRFNTMLTIRTMQIVESSANLDFSKDRVAFTS